MRQRKNQDMIRERVKTVCVSVCVQEEKKEREIGLPHAAYSLRGRCMEWRGQWDAVIG